MAPKWEQALAINQLLRKLGELRKINVGIGQINKFETDFFADSLQRFVLTNVSEVHHLSEQLDAANAICFTRLLELILIHQPTLQ